MLRFSGKVVCARLFSITSRILFFLNCIYPRVGDMIYDILLRVVLLKNADYPIIACVSVRIGFQLNDFLIVYFFPFLFKKTRSPKISLFVWRNWDIHVY